MDIDPERFGRGRAGAAFIRHYPRHRLSPGQGQPASVISRKQSLCGSPNASIQDLPRQKSDDAHLARKSGRNQTRFRHVATNKIAVNVAFD